MRKFIGLLSLSFFFLNCPGAPQKDSLLGLTLVSDGANTQVPAAYTVIDATKQTQLDAVEQTATTNTSCTNLGSFYWEIGDQNGSLGYASVNGSTNASTVLYIASASKWIWGAYVLEKIGTPGANEKSYLRMLSDYDNFNDNKCNFLLSVNSCFTNGPGSDGTHNNNYLDTANAGKFFYDSGHFEAYAASNPSNLTPALTNYYHVQLGDEVANTIFGGSNPGFTYASPLLAGGGKTTANVYAQFLRRVLHSDLVISNYLGLDPVPTHPYVHPTLATYSPFVVSATTEDVHYSYAHWVEDSPQSDGAFSSPGKFGFYPWIDSGKTTYGILARYSTAPLAYIQSVYCGRLLRKAYFTGVPQ